MIVAVVPVKGLKQAKSRLSPYLADAERASLVLHLAGRAVRAIRDTGLVETVAVATPEPGTAFTLGAEHLQDMGGLNRTLSAAAGWAQGCGASGLLILPCDLPMVTPAEVAEMLAQGPGVTIAPAGDGGTGALYLAPPQAIRPQFGEGSHARHILSARRHGIPIHEIDRDGLRHDLDTVEDLRRFRDLLRAS